MSKPRTSTDPKNINLNTLLGEIMSAMSALNMQPEPLNPPVDDSGYLSSIDAWANHAVEHLQEALMITSKMAVKFNRCDLRWKIGRWAAKNKLTQPQITELESIISSVNSLIYPPPNSDTLDESEEEKGHEI